LHQNNLLDQGYVSLLMKQLISYSNLTGIDLFDYIHSHYRLDALPHFEQAYQNTRSQIPFRNFEEINNLLPYILDVKGVSYNQALAYKFIRINNTTYTINDIIDFLLVIIVIVIIICIY
jgi:hypothetical protein